MCETCGKADGGKRCRYIPASGATVQAPAQMNRTRKTGINRDLERHGDKPETIDSDPIDPDVDSDPTAPEPIDPSITSVAAPALTGRDILLPLVHSEPGQALRGGPKSSEGGEMLARLRWSPGFTLLAALAAATPAAAEVDDLVLARQYGIGYLQFMVMEHEKLIEKHAKALGLGDIKVSWKTVTDGAAINDALLSGNVHVGSGGVGAFVTLWARTKGTLEVKGIAAMSAMPLFLNSRDPRIKTVKDFTPNDRIALPGVKVSPQATTLQHAAADAFGEQSWNKLDPITVNMSHPVGMQAMLTSAEVKSHFTSPPYQYLELEQPGVHRVLSTYEVWGGKLTIFVAWATSRFRNENPRTYQAIYEAIGEATQFINKDRKAAAKIYLDMSKEKESVESIVKFLDDPDIDYSPIPHKLQKFAEFKYEIGSNKIKPASWKEMFFPEVQSLNGD
jgi:NitT/TauT family transport system substrate-binding protein